MKKLRTSLAVLGILALPIAGFGQEVGIAELTPEVERAIERGLNELAQSQNLDGSWGNRFPVASTSLSLMAFMVKGQFPGRPPNGNTLSRAVDFLVETSNRHPQGFMGNRTHGMYEHALATLALSEVAGMVPRQDVYEVLKKAVDLILKSQNSQGGWRYHPRPMDADVSATVMQIVALASAKEAGIMVPDEAIARALDYVRFCYDEPSGGFGYARPGQPEFGRSAAGVLSLMLCGDRDSDMVKNGIQYLLNLPPRIFEGYAYYYYCHYYAIQVMYQAGEEYYQAWYPKIRDALLAKQLDDGSWHDRNDVGTQMAILILGVPYRFLPIYQR